MKHSDESKLSDIFNRYREDVSKDNRMAMYLNTGSKGDLLKFDIKKSEKHTKLSQDLT